MLRAGEAAGEAQPFAETCRTAACAFSYRPELKLPTQNPQMLNAQATVRQHGLAGGGDAPGRGPRAATEPAHSPKTFSVFFSVAPLRSRFSEPRGLQRQEDQSGAGADGRRCSGWEPRPGPDRLGFKRKSCKRGVAYTRIAEAA